MAGKFDRELDTLAARYQAVRRATEQLCVSLEPEDYCLQSMPEASPVKWHLAHTTWFFETFLLTPRLKGYRPFCEEFSFLFNSYYEAVGPRWPRAKRGLLSRPTVKDVFAYRKQVDRAVAECPLDADARGILEIGIQHEQQHQELIVTDLKHAWSFNPLRPTLCEFHGETGRTPEQRWIDFPEGVVSIGHAGSGFAFDNESPRHRVFLNSFQLSNRLATNGDWLAFMADGGYERPELWLSDGWAACQAAGWKSPLYWERDGANWSIVTLSGPRPTDGDEPVCHVSFYEADAFARWRDARLPTEAEWEIAAESSAIKGHFQESQRFHPSSVPVSFDRGPLYQLYGDVWQWTASAYLGYPGYRPPAGAIGEYNGKFMCNQFTLRGASCATPKSHARVTYRNFFPPDARWQFAGVRLAKDVE